MIITHGEDGKKVVYKTYEDYRKAGGNPIEVFEPSIFACNEKCRRVIQGKRGSGMRQFLTYGFWFIVITSFAIFLSWEAMGVEVIRIIRGWL